MDGAVHPTVDLERRVAVLLLAQQRELGVVLRRGQAAVLVAVVAARVAGQLVAPAAQKLIDRHPEQLAGDVPQRDVHRPRRRAVRRAPRPLQVVPDDLPLQRVAANQVLRGPSVHIARHLAGYAGVGFDPQDAAAGLPARARRVQRVPAVARIEAQVGQFIFEMGHHDPGDVQCRCHVPPLRRPSYSLGIIMITTSPSPRVPPANVPRNRSCKPVRCWADARASLRQLRQHPQRSQRAQSLCTGEMRVAPEVRQRTLRPSRRPGCRHRGSRRRRPRPGTRSRWPGLPEPPTWQGRSWASRRGSRGCR